MKTDLELYGTNDWEIAICYLAILREGRYHLDNNSKPYLLKRTAAYMTKQTAYMPESLIRTEIIKTADELRSKARQ